MKEGYDNTGVSSLQIESGVFDGVYFHCSIEDHLTKLYNLKPGKVLYTHDLLHRTGLVDKHLTAQLKFLQEIIPICQQIFTTFNWGADYEKFREATAVWRLTQRNLVNFSDTRFANSKRKVFKNIHYQFAPIVSCLEEQIIAGVRNRSGQEPSDSKVRDKADLARELKGKVLNLNFLLTLSGLVDIYDQFGAIVQVTQMVTLLPHERLDLYTKAVSRLDNMGLAQDHKDCEQFFNGDEKVKCLWPVHHADKKTYKEKKMIRGMYILDEQGVQAAGLGILTRRQKGENIVMAKENTEKKCDEKLLKVVKGLSAGLSNDVYSPEGKAVIEETRVILDLPTLALKLKEPGASVIKVSLTEFPRFNKAVFKVPVDSIKEIPEQELKSQYKLFLERLHEMTKDLDKDILSKTDSKELIQKFLDPAGELFKDIEMIMQALVVCSVKHSCESVLESFVSMYENHFDVRRNTEEDATNEEFEI